MPHTIVSNVCEGVADCVDACPVACIHPGSGSNSKGNPFYWIDFNNIFFLFHRKEQVATGPKNLVFEILPLQQQQQQR